MIEAFLLIVQGYRIHESLVDSPYDVEFVGDDVLYFYVIEILLHTVV